MSQKHSIKNNIGPILCCESMVKKINQTKKKLIKTLEEIHLEEPSFDFRRVYHDLLHKH